jgi:hypothetical protein
MFEVGLSAGALGFAWHGRNITENFYSNRCPIGNLRSLNDLARQARADHIIHTGDFGFYDDTSLGRIAEK